jgi:predicted nucleotidyltransferase
MATVNYQLQKIAGDLFIKYDSDERTYIEEKVKNFKLSLKNYFGTNVSDVVLFGSFKRDTILPRKFDKESDIDVLIVFRDTEQGYTPETYRNRLRRFAETSYFSSKVVKDHPSIVLEMSNIKFDLVPCKIESILWSTTYQIPDKSGSWMDTDPKGFNEKLTEANNRFNSIVKPIIRLLKRWNAYENYPYLSFELEQIIADMYFKGDNFQTGFIYAIKNLPTSDLVGYQKRKVEVARKNIEWVEEYLSRQSQDKATEVVNRILGLK